MAELKNPLRTSFSEAGVSVARHVTTWACGQISQSSSITFPFTTSPSPTPFPTVTHLTYLYFPRRTKAYLPRFLWTLRHTLNTFTSRPLMRGSGNLNIHCWHCAELARGQKGSSPLRTDVPYVWEFQNIFSSKLIGSLHLPSRLNANVSPNFQNLRIKGFKL